MRQVISSRWTIVFKLLVPLTLVALSVFFVLSRFSYSPGPPADGLIGTSLILIATAFFSWWGWRLKRVSLDEQNLYVSNWFKETAIPLSEVVAFDSLVGGWPILVRLRAGSDFGRGIVFLAPWRPLLFSSHPILEELRQLISQHK
ncbi:MAG: hypothetical protein ABI596_09630 [Pyrinomonadaceae bacterium]